MLIIGASGFAREILEIFHRKGEIEDIAFFDDVNAKMGNKLFDKFPILKNEAQVADFFKRSGTSFTIGIGDPILRCKMYKKFMNIGGKCVTLISSKANIGNYDVVIGEGVIIMSGVNVSNSVQIGKGSMIYYNSNVTHDCIIGEFVEISPSVNVLGRVHVGSFCNLGTNCTILPDVKIGNNVIVGAGAVVTKDVEDNSVVVGVPARIVRKISET
jgi:sugar O-acyltransferase (sialic acid O-acetyltransferase NeuD family)